MMGIVLVMLCLAGAGDWPRFRGPNSDGHADGPATPMDWSDTTNVSWKVPVPGLGWSSPVVAEGKVFLTTAVPRGEGLSLRAMAFDAESGQTVWDKEIRAIDEAPAIHAKNSHASPTPIWHDGAVFVHFGALGMAKLSAADGSLVWMNTELVYPPVHGSGGSPAMHDGRLFVVCDGSSRPFVAAVDASTGRTAWKTPRSVPARISHSFGTPTVVTAEHKSQLIAPGPEHLAAYDLASGKELWKVLAPGWSVVPQPATGHGMVFYNHDFDTPEMVAVRLGGSGDVTESHVAWRMKRGAPSTPSPLLVGDELYFVSDLGIATCVDAKTGDQHWQKRLGDNYSASPVFANDSILFLSENGLATWVKPGTAFEEIRTNTVPGRTYATPAFSRGAMYLRTDEHLYKVAK